MKLSKRLIEERKVTILQHHQDSNNQSRPKSSADTKEENKLGGRGTVLD